MYTSAIHRITTKNHKCVYMHVEHGKESFFCAEIFLSVDKASSHSVYVKGSISGLICTVR